MKRSEINTALRSAEAMLAHHLWALPDWAGWDMADVLRHRDHSRWLAERQLGWDVTDFGSGEFAARGLTLFCVRNGLAHLSGEERPYAEKLLFVGVGQETPFHAHKHKLEDIIVRGGGTLCVAFTPEGYLGTGAPPQQIRIDGAAHPAFDRIHRLRAGQSITIPRGLQHRFWGEEAPVFVAEVSQCNDDQGDNFFLGGQGRFSEVEEDEPPYRLLWNEVPQ
ncbi:D-lyxose/D-mannose family sugar isomerase [Thioclava sp. GXIMD4216]|uniref:D-lyxose/D-mannose family sugar isomerase n=1 Tax=Thioclava sp. GXIMD4216 TaxID=3131929 RepID=UPI0030CFA497